MRGGWKFSLSPSCPKANGHLVYTESGNRRLLPSVVGNCQLPWLMAPCTNGANRTSTSAGKKPPFGFIPRKVTGDQVREALVNSYTPLSTRYLRQGKDYLYTRRWTSSSDVQHKPDCCHRRRDWIWQDNTTLFTDRIP
ncbi:hypothetical protein M404DRAFT_476681 [Pisolithus tinctorius Marx 270]|uniref:Uncharacterized protein n=1 Tax=Pisolithus tinctorius Marx 270 TaxID=870435 RepID=A0A0C3PYS3_PISTI|nr:hypothetical protein M404DRAFT_476681 [Pisolithus tinctorius Marx 270]